jgi:2,5-dihydroxypyridine 5,6-dioxygenase
MSQYGMADEPGRSTTGASACCTLPERGSANGKVVFAPGDIVILPYCRYVVDPVGPRSARHIVSIEGGVDAALMRDWLAEGQTGARDRDPYAVSHVGWGLNPQCRWDSLALYGDAPERSRAAARSFPGNFLFSTGPNTQGGGKRTTRGHYDVPMRSCTISLDGRIVVENGRVVDPQMQVARVAS